MNRRGSLLAILALGAAPLCASAQQQGRVWRIGFLGSGSASAYAYRINAFRSGLRDFGYVEGKNVLIEYRWAAGNYESLPQLANELVRLPVDLLVTHATLGARAARQASLSIPIVLTDITDPVALGIVESLGRPGGNVTGSTFFAPQISAKRLQLLKEAMPRITRVGLLLNPTTPAAAVIFDETEKAAKLLKVKLQQFESRQPEDFEQAFAAMAQSRVDALMIQDEPLFTPNKSVLANLANRHRLPSAGYGEFAEAGGMIGYGLDFRQLYRRAAYFVDRIFNGSKPADLPMEQPTRFELVINVKTANALKLTIPQSVLLRADKVIE